MENQLDEIILVDEEDILESELADPKARAEWDESAVARAIANMIISIRAEQELTQKQLSEKLGMTQPQISRLESGEHIPDFKTLIRLAAGLNIEIMIDIAPTNREVSLPKKQAVSRGSITQIEHASSMILATA